MANIYVKSCEKCGQPVYSTSLEEAEEMLVLHVCPNMVDYRAMPLEEYIELIKKRLRK